MDYALVSLGNYIFVVSQERVYTAGHPLDIALRREGWEDGNPMSMGDDMWVGGHVLPRVTDCQRYCDGG